MIKQKIYSGYNAYKKLDNILKNISPKKIFLVAGKSSYAKSGAEKLLKKILINYDYILFTDFTPNPQIDDVAKGAEIFKKQKCDVVIGVGGGSVLDTAKAISILSTQNTEPHILLNNTSLFSNRRIPSIMIPTTAGTGSESTHFCVIYENKTKKSLDHSSVLPDFAVLDPNFIMSLPPYISACTAMDAFCQSIESFWSVKSTAKSKYFSEKAIKTILGNIVKSINKPDRSSREKMLLASNFAGRAINISKTTAPHAVSYPITSYFNVPHGHAVALTLPYFIEFNYDIKPEQLQDKRGERFVRKTMDKLIRLLKTKNPSDAKNKILNIMSEINLATRLSQLKIKKEDIDVIVKNGLTPERVINNPKKVTESDLRNMLLNIL